MPSTTSPAGSRFVLNASHARPEPSRRRRYPSIAGELSSPAGLHPRPWQRRLLRALREELFELHYQPIVCLQSGAVSHYEALVRLADQPAGSLVAPASFLPAAERYGLIRDLDKLVIGQVVALLGGELAVRDTRIAVNLSALSITDQGMLAYIERELDRCRVDPSRLIVEVTETAAIGDMHRARAFCEGVHALGSSIALDDFGAGFGSFQYLKHLPFRYLKIDGDFIRALPSSRKDQLVVRALADLAAGMGKQTIAEYVGDQPTIGLLRNYGVDFAQGFGLGRPCAQVEAFA